MKTENIEVLNLTDLIRGVLAGAKPGSGIKAQVSDPIDVESSFFRFPEPVRAIFNVKTEETVTLEAEPGEKPVKAKRRLEHPVLASKVFFDDGTWTVVKNSAEDPIELVTKYGVETASDASKERAIVYAWVKRLCGTQHPPTGEVTGANLGRRLSKIVAASEDKAVSKATKAKVKAAKAKAKAAKEKAEPEAKPAAKCSCGRDKAVKAVLEAINAAIAALNKKGPEGA
jgi:hypothetical protein